MHRHLPDATIVNVSDALKMTKHDVQSNAGATIFHLYSKGFVHYDYVFIFYVFMFTFIPYFFFFCFLMFILDLILLCPFYITCLCFRSFMF